MQKTEFYRDWTFTDGKVPFIRGNTRKVDLPHDFMIEKDRDPGSPTRRDGGYFPGCMGWYKKTFFAPEEWRGKNVFVEFEGVYMNAEISLNRNIITRQNYGYTTFHVCLDEFLNYGKDNEITVFVDDSTVPNSRWYSGAGIYRYVWLWTCEKSHFDFGGLYVRTVEADARSALLRIETDYVKEDGYAPEDYDISFELTDPNGRKTVMTSEGDGLFRITDPLIWDTETPYLYSLKAVLLRNGTPADTTETAFGIRTFSVSAENGLVLNGRKIKLRGGCVHHDNGLLGSESYRRSEERKIELLKKAGYNAVRTAHNPPAPAFLDACDRLGMIVLDEAFDQWRNAKTQYDYHSVFDTDHEHDLKSFILRDRNHPSVLFWSIGNELCEQEGISRAPQTSRKLCEIIRRYDDRPLTMAFCPVTTDKNIKYTDYPEKNSGQDRVSEPVDIVGYNYYFDKYEQIHEIHPERIIIGTETVPKEIYDSWGVTEKLPYVIGDFVWTSIDYLGEAAIGTVYSKEERPEAEWHLYDYPRHFANCGDFDICGFKRPQSYYRDILWNVTDEMYIFARKPKKWSSESEQVTFWGWRDEVTGWDFDLDKGTPVKVDVYTRAEEVTLYLNGKPIGSVRPEKLAAEFTVPYEKGVLKAVDSDGRTAILTSAGEPYAVKLTADRDRIGSDLDLCYVTAEITDRDGRRVTNAVNKIAFSVQGPGTVAALGSYDIMSEEKYRGNIRSAFEGRLMCVIKSTGKGDIELTAVSDGLKTSAIVIKAE